MKKYQWTVVVTFLMLAGCLAALEGGALGTAAGIAIGAVCSGLLILALIKLDVFEFPEGSKLERVALRIQNPAVSAPELTEQPLSSAVILDMRPHTAA